MKKYDIENKLAFKFLRRWRFATKMDPFNTKAKLSSKVCELHFAPSDVERETSMFDTKTGRKLTTPYIISRDLFVLLNTKMCTNCGTTSTSVWSKDDTGYLLCHACFFYNQALKKTKTKRIGQHCSNCKTTTTSSWRRNNSGEIVCNACGLYLKLHGINRPLALMKDNISTRRRKPKDNGGPNDPY